VAGRWIARIRITSAFMNLGFDALPLILGQHRHRRTFGHLEHESHILARHDPFEIWRETALRHGRPAA